MWIANLPFNEKNTLKQWRSLKEWFCDVKYESKITKFIKEIVLKFTISFKIWKLFYNVYDFEKYPHVA